jgi:hypothetical protein
MLGDATRQRCSSSPGVTTSPARGKKVLVDKMERQGSLELLFIQGGILPDKAAEESSLAGLLIHFMLRSVLVDADTGEWDDVAFGGAVSLLGSLSLICREDDEPYSFFGNAKHCEGLFGIWQGEKPFCVLGKYFIHSSIQEWLLLEIYEMSVARAWPLVMAFDQEPQDLLMREFANTHDTNDGFLWLVYQGSAREAPLVSMESCSCLESTHLP